MNVNDSPVEAETNDADKENPAVAAFYTPEKIASATVYQGANLTSFATTEKGVLYIAVALGTVENIPENTSVMAFPTPRDLGAYINALCDVYHSFGRN